MVDERPALLLLPGLGLGPEAWEPTVRSLRQTALFSDLSVLPLPGYGLSGHADDDLSPSSLARTVVARLAGGGPTTVLAGHSASCQVAAHAAAEATGTVVGLVLVGPTTDPQAHGWPRLAVRWLATARHERPEQVPLLVRQYRRTTLRSMARAMDAARWDDVRRTLTRVSCPVVVVRGAHDKICPADWASSLAPTVTVPGGGHMVPLTHGDQVATTFTRLADPI